MPKMTAEQGMELLGNDLLRFAEQMMAEAESEFDMGRWFNMFQTVETAMRNYDFDVLANFYQSYFGQWAVKMAIKTLVAIDGPQSLDEVQDTIGGVQ